jgi:Fe-S cluster assembly ATP-binding protein
VITHYSRLLSELKPDHVHILVKGRIVASGGPELAEQLDTDGYAAFAAPEDLVADQPTTTRPVERPGSLNDLFAI